MEAVMAKAWFRGVISQPEEVSGRPVTVHRRDIRDYAADIQNAQRRIEIKRAELAAAEQQLADSQAAFIDHCKELGLPLAIEPGIWPPRDWKLEG
jgi:formate-dependent phosphoribosylglycinamide formyltransferase (GAR transformylase)